MRKLKVVLWSTLVLAVLNWLLWTILLCDVLAADAAEYAQETCPSDHVYSLVWTGRMEFEAGKPWYIMRCPLGHEFRRETPK